jgi:hypothetical protein
VRFLEHPPIRRGSGDPQKPFSSLSEVLRDRFTIYIEAGEMTCDPHLHILGTTMYPWLVVRVNII